MAQHKRRTLGGPRYNKPHEVHDELLALGKNFNEFYDAIMRNAFIRWDLDADEVWVEGRFRASSEQMMRWTGLAKSSFYINRGKVIDAGLIRREEDGIWLVTMVIKKEEVAVADVELRKMQQQQVEMFEELQEVKENYRRVTAILEKFKAKMIGSGDPDNSGTPDGSSGTPDKKGSSPESPILLKVLNKKNSHSSLNIIVTNFYKGIDQKKISSEKRERAINIGKKLLKDGYLLDDIEYAVEWTLEHATEEVYDFGLIQHTISQSIAEKSKIEKKKQAAEKRRKAEEEERLEREAEERQRQEIETYKGNLNQDERDKLREKAQEELSKAGLSGPFVTDFLLNIKENEILRREVEEKR